MWKGDRDRKTKRRNVGRGGLTGNKREYAVECRAEGRKKKEWEEMEGQTGGNDKKREKRKADEGGAQPD